MEADFRFSLARLREYSEQVALLGGERDRAIRRSAGASARSSPTISRSSTGARSCWPSPRPTARLSPIIPFIFTAPFYFAGTIPLGVMTQTAGAFARVEGALTFFINYYTSLAGFKSVVDRLTSFDAAIDRARALGAKGPSAPAKRPPRQRSARGSRDRLAGRSPHRRGREPRPAAGRKRAGRRAVGLR